MSQSGYTPILIYASGTATNVPLAANLTSGASGAELAINYTDGKLFYKDNAGVVQTLATKATGSIGGSNTQVQYNSSGSLAGSANLTFDGTTLTAAGLAGPHNGTVGATTPNTGAFTTLSASSTVSGTGFSTYLASPPAIGGTVANTGKFSALTNTALTSGRVVYSTTGGLETDSANLTFDGTTLTANALTTTSTVTINGGTANGVAYLNGSKVLTTGSALTFDGTNFQVGGNSQPIIRAVSSSTNNATARIFTDGDTAYIGSANTSTTGGSVPVVFQVGGTEQMRLNSTGLGIGTSSPGSKLQVNGTGVAISKIVDSSTTGYSGLTFSGTGTQNYAIGMGGPSETSFGVANKWFLYDGLAGAMRMTVGSAGNVTINAPASGTALTVNGTGSFTGQTNAQAFEATSTPGSYASSGGTNLSYNGSGVAVLRAYSNSAGTGTGQINFNIAGTQAMTLDASGNLGIGTSSPAFRLDVRGTATDLFQVKSTGAYTFSRFQSSARNWALSIGSSFDVYDETAAATRMSIDTSGNVGIGTSSPGTKLDVRGTINSSDSTNGNIRAYVDASAAYLQSLNQAANAYRPLTLMGSTVLLANNGVTNATLDTSGNLGLGVTPSAWGSPFKAYDMSVSSFANEGTVATHVVQNAYYNGTNWIYKTTANASRALQYAGQHIFYTAPSGTAGNAITFTQAMTLDANGNLGVGITSPATVLHAAGSTGLTLGAITGNAWRTAAIAAIDEGASFKGTLAFYTHASAGAAGAPTERARINSSGYLGIGTTNPLQPLVVSNAGAQGFEFVPASGIMQTYNRSGAAYTDMRFDASQILFFTGSSPSERARIDSSGNLLVGTTTSAMTAGGVRLKNGGGNLGEIALANNSGVADYVARFLWGSTPTLVGNITVSSTATAYNTSSDARLKDNITDADSTSSLIDSLKVRQFDWKADGSHQRYGFIAQELLPVAPEAVHQPQDPDDMMSVDYSKLVPMLVKEIQDLRARISVLENK